MKNGKYIKVRSLRVGMLLAFLFIASIGNAEVFYISQNGSGTKDGMSLTNSSPISWLKTAGNWGSGTGKIGAGDKVHLCGTITEAFSILGSGTKGNPIILFFRKDAKMSAPYWNYNGAISINNKEYIVIDGGVNGIIEATDNGTLFGNKKLDSRGIVCSVLKYSEIKNLSIKNMYVRKANSDDNCIGSTSGIRMDGNCYGTVIHHNNICEAEYGIWMIFRNGTKNIRLHSNVISATANGIFAGPGGTNDNADSIFVNNNEIIDGYQWEGSWINDQGNEQWFHVDGIQIFAVTQNSWIKNLQVYNNYVRGNLGTHVSGWIFLQGRPGNNGFVYNPLVYNNVMQADSLSWPANGFIHMADVDTPEVYNNTIVSWGKGTAISITAQSPNAKIINNIAYKTLAGVYTYAPMSICENNLYYGLGPNMFFKEGVFIKSMEAWQQNGHDRDGYMADPRLDVNHKPRKQSPAMDKGYDLSSVFITDKDNIKRPQGGAWDIGAYEFSLSISDPKMMLDNPVLFSMADDLTGIEQMQNMHAIHLYPNPSQGSFFVSYPAGTSAVLEIFNMLGERIYMNSSFTGKEQVELNSIDKGLYYVRISEGEKAFTKHLVID